jgi:lipoprotein-anchoring transpeptidase ErfK/SrfK
LKGAWRGILWYPYCNHRHILTARDIPMDNKAITAAQAIKNAAQALVSGNKPVARYWAQQTAFLDREAAEPWLLLAQVCGPRARVVYLEQALKAQPGNQAVLDTLHQAKDVQRKQLEIAADCLGPVDKKRAGSGPVVRSHPAGLWIILSVVFLTAALVTASALCFGFSEGVSQVHARFSPRPDAIAAAEIEGPTPTATSSPTATYTPFTAVTNTPTSTPTPLPTATATPSPMPSPTDAPPVPQRPASAHHNGKSIVVSISEQRVYAYEGDELVFNFVASTGRNNLTLPGNFRILDKIPNAYSNPWGFWMPYWMGIYWVGSNLENGFHSLPVLYNNQEIWGDEIGTPITYGCVVLSPGEMKQLFSWADIGTPVEIIR